MFDLWGRAKVRWPKLASWDRLADQTHVQHTMVTVLVFGTIGVLYFAATHRFAPVAFSDGLAKGVAAGLVFYFIREFFVEHIAYVLVHGCEDPSNSWWDSTLDFLVPLAWTGWLPVVALRVALPWWLGTAWWSLNLAICYLYTFGRPSWARY